MVMNSSAWARGPICMSSKTVIDFSPFDQIPIGRFLLLSLLACGVPNSCVLVSEIPQFTETFRNLASFGILVTFLLALGALFFVSPCSLLLLIFPGTRGLGIRLLLLCIAYVLTLTLMAGAGSTIRKASFRALAERSMPLVEAVKAFEKAEGHPPMKLDDLVPSYLDAVPSTGLAAYPHYEIHMGEESSMWKGNPWVLCVPVSRSVLNWDLFLWFIRFERTFSIVASSVRI